MRETGGWVGLGWRQMRGAEGALWPHLGCLEGMGVV